MLQFFTILFTPLYVYKEQNVKKHNYHLIQKVNVHLLNLNNNYNYLFLQNVMYPIDI